MPATLSESARKIFAEPNFAHLATLMPDGSPQVTPVWVDLEDDHILVNTAEGRVKPRNVRRDPRVAISICRQENPYAAVFIRGRVVRVTHDGAEELIDKLAKKYIGQDRYPWRVPGEQRVTLVVEPDRVSATLAD